MSANMNSFIQSIDFDRVPFQGCAFGVVQGDSVLCRLTKGFRKNSTGPITSKTLFPLASISKALSGLMVGCLMEKGQLSLDQPFHLEYLRDPVRLKHILSHTTGYMVTGNYQIEKGTSITGLQHYLSLKKPSFQPGDHFYYSNVMFNLVQDCLPNLPGLGILGIQKLPLNPADETAFPHKRLSTKRGQPFNALPFPSYYPKTVPYAAGHFGSLDGMLEVIQLALGHRPHQISQETLDQIYTPIIETTDVFDLNVSLPFPRDTVRGYYCVGWRMLRSTYHPGQDLIYHGGFINGIRVFVGIIPSLDTGIVILMNQNTKWALNTGFRWWGHQLDAHG